MPITSFGLFPFCKKVAKLVMLPPTKCFEDMKKSQLPVKICKTCGRPFSWRKKWVKVWEEVKYCSHRCRANRKTKKAQTAGN
ncbi:DUF2256 domain-containing protein [Persicobacter sp. CCB-QB2]|uniref:DUF2256 domain-containing protein n=1 Tax=Persicobacter sp. CCB-QB2 TaxID=1561025 RepID=UPI0006A9DCDF